ncbi:MAG: citrate synthase [Gammaproteobacteria bacterium]
MTSETVTITDNSTGKTIECPILKGTYGAPVIDTAALYKELGMFTLDPGFTTTASCRSAITYLDGEQGILLHRGYPIEQLAEKSSFLEVSYLLLHGELPTETEFAAYEGKIKQYNMVHEHLMRFFNGYRYDAHPMSIMVGVTGAMASFYHETVNVKDPEDRLKIAMRLVAKMPNIGSKVYKHGVGEPFIYPDNSLGYIENLMNMMFAIPSQPYELHPKAVSALDQLMILHADHEQNASTSTVRLSGSSEANPLAAISAGISTLWGKAHGGANEAVLEMLEEIEDVKNIPKFIARAKDKDDGYRLMGFGHRVYKNFDPRATIISKACHEVLDDMDENSELRPLMEIAMELERIALEDEYFIERKLYPNVDFYSGIILRALGIPTNMFTVFFAMARSAGWIANWHEMMGDSDFRIGRPRQLYTGSATREYIAMDKR